MIVEVLLYVCATAVAAVLLDVCMKAAKKNDDKKKREARIMADEEEV